jgi:hypothetical protein
MALLGQIHNLMKRGGTPNGTAEWSAVLLQTLCDTLSNIKDQRHGWQAWCENNVRCKA